MSLRNNGMALNYIFYNGFVILLYIKVIFIIPGASFPTTTTATTTTTTPAVTPGNQIESLVLILDTMDHLLPQVKSCCCENNQTRSSSTGKIPFGMISTVDKEGKNMDDLALSDKLRYRLQSLFYQGHIQKYQRAILPPSAVKL